MGSPDSTADSKTKFGIEPGNTELKKRKFESEDRENVSGSPRKKRGLDQNRKLAEVDINTAHLKESNISVKDIRAVVKEPTLKEQENKLSVPSLDIVPAVCNKSRSPRRQVLTKNIHLAQSARLFGSKPSNYAASSKKTIVLGSGSKAVYKAVPPSACQCFGQPQICTVCMSR